MSKVSIIVLNWNGKKFLKNCLDSLTQLAYPQVEIIVVDNNSKDGSQEFVKENYRKAILIENKENYGFAKGNNIGLKASTGDYILILNNDTVVAPNFLEPLIKDFEDNPKIAYLQPQIRLSENKQFLDGAGAFLTFTGFLYHFGYLKDRMKQKYNKKMKIFLFSLKRQTYVSAFGLPGIPLCMNRSLLYIIWAEEIPLLPILIKMRK